MRRGLHQRLVGGCDLARLGDLERLRAIGVRSPERAASRLAFIANHAADTGRTVEHGAQQGRIVVGGQFDAQTLFDELHDRLQLGTAHLERFEVLESPILQIQQDAGQYLFIADRIAAPRIGRHVVDVLDEHQVGVDFVQVLD